MLVEDHRSLIEVTLRKRKVFRVTGYINQCRTHMVRVASQIRVTRMLQNKSGLTESHLGETIHAEMEQELENILKQEPEIHIEY